MYRPIVLFFSFNSSKQHADETVPGWYELLPVTYRYQLGTSLDKPVVPVLKRSVGKIDLEVERMFRSIYDGNKSSRNSGEQPIFL